MKSNIPWYKTEKYWVDLALRYIKPIHEKKIDGFYKAELKTFSDINIGRTIFESNLIEGAGLSDGETQKVLQKYFPKIPDNLSLVREFPFEFREIFSSKKIGTMYNAIKTHGLDPKKIYPSVTMADKSRNYREVVQHFLAVSESIRQTLKFLLRLNHRALDLLLTDDSISEEQKLKIVEIQDLGSSEFSNLLKTKSRRKLLTERVIKKIHNIMSIDMIPPDAEVAPGEYRIDDRMVGWDIVFPAPSLISRSMNMFISTADTIINKSLIKQINMFEAAAKISYKFVSIHPFPDFNGRMSRLIMNMVLLINNCPFPIAIRGDNKNKQRYFYSLKRANNGDSSALTTLIAMRTVETFKELEKHLKLAGLKPIISD